MLSTNADMHTRGLVVGTETISQSQPACIITDSDSQQTGSTLHAARACCAVSRPDRRNTNALLHYNAMQLCSKHTVGYMCLLRRIDISHALNIIVQTTHIIILHRRTVNRIPVTEFVLH